MTDHAENAVTGVLAVLGALVVLVVALSYLAVTDPVGEEYAPLMPVEAPAEGVGDE